MRIQHNSDAQINPLQNQNNVSKASDARKAEQKNGNVFTVPGAVSNGDDLIQQRQGLARKQALKVVADAFDGEKKLDAQMQSIKDEIMNLQDEINEKNTLIGENNAKIKQLQEQYGIDPSADKNLSKEEMARYSEYQEQVSPLYSQNESMTYDVEKYKAMQKGYVQGYSDMKSERLKSQDMLKSQDAAEEIMDAVNMESISILTKEALEHVDEEQAEREQEAKEMAEKRAAEKESKAQKEEDKMMDIIGAKKTIISDATSLEDTQEAVNTEIANILNRLGLISNDVKGSTIDNQI
ncbi:MAG: hypothetical protein K6F75_11155 [Butyrivibrio sp.]|nr:hypothetical protein [Butyrivibrio sp.]